MKNNEKPDNPGQAVGWLYAAASCHATTIRVFTSHSFGSEALGWHGLGAMLIIFAYAGLTQAPEMVLYLAAWFVALIVQRIITTVRMRRGWAEHSRYSGWPWLTIRFPFVKTEQTAKVLEAALCLFGGVFLMPLSPALGNFIFCGFFSILIKNGIEAGVYKARARALRDAQIEQQAAVSFYHGYDDE